jgi:hypothetical protein
MSVTNIKDLPETSNAFVLFLDCAKIQYRIKIFHRGIKVCVLHMHQTRREEPSLNYLFSESQTSWFLRNLILTRDTQLRLVKKSDESTKEGST